MCQCLDSCECVSAFEHVLAARTNGAPGKKGNAHWWETSKLNSWSLEPGMVGGDMREDRFQSNLPGLHWQEHFEVSTNDFLFLLNMEKKKKFQPLKWHMKSWCCYLGNIHWNSAQGSQRLPIERSSKRALKMVID